MDLFNLVATLSLDSSAYEAGLNSAKNLASSVGGAVGNGLKTIAKVGVAAVGAATTAMTGFAMSSVSTGQEFDKSMSQVAATMGKTMDEMAKETGTVDLAWGTFTGNLREYAQEMGKNTAFSATQAADALNYMALAGYSTQESMEMLPNVLNLAAAGNMDLARASDMVTDTQTAFGISAKRTTQMVNEMAKAASTGNTSVEQLGDAFLVVGGLAQELNGGMVMLEDGTMVAADGAQELEIALTAMANAGIKGGEAGTHMRNMLLKLSDPTDAGTKALIDMGVAIFDNEGKMNSLTDIFHDLNSELSNMTQQDKIGVISDLFNTRDMAAAEALLGAVEGEVVKVGDETYSLGTAYEKFGDAIYDSSQGFEIVRSSWNEIGEAILGANEAGVLYEGKLYSMKEAQEQFGDSIYDASKGFQVLGAAEVMALTQLDNLAGDITFFQSALEGAKIAVSDQLTPSLREFVQFGTSGLSKLTDAFQDGGVTGAMSAFGEVLSDGLNMIIDKLPSFVNAGMELLGALGQGLIDNLPKITDTAIYIVKELASSIINAIPALTDGAVQIISQLGNALIENAPQLISQMASVANYIITALVNNFDNAVDGIGKIVEVIGKGIEENAPALKENLLNLVSKIADYILENTDSLLESGLDLMLKLGEGLMEAIPSIYSYLTELVVKIVSFFGEHASEIAVAGAEIIKTIATSLAENLPTLIESLAQLVVDLATALTDPDVLTPILEGAVSIILALAEGLLTAIPKLLEAVPVIVENLVGAIVENLPLVIDTAIQLLMALAQAIIENLPLILAAAVQIVFALISGLIEALPSLVMAVLDLIASVISTLIESLPAFIENGIKIVGALIEGVVKMFGSIIKAGLDLITQFIKGITNGFTKIVNAGKNVVNKFKDGIKQKINEAKQWGKDLIGNFIEGITSKISSLGSAVSGAASVISGFLHFSEPDVGPLSNFHTFAPDMMKLFAKGITDNEDMLARTVADAFDFSDLITTQVPKLQGPQSVLNKMESERGENRNLTVILQLDRSQFAKAVYSLNNEEIQRVGVNLAGGYT